MDTAILTLLIVAIVLLLGLIGIVIWLVIRQQESIEVDNLAKTSLTMFGDVNENLGRLAVEITQIQEVGKGIADLHDILAAPTLRGALGEQLLEDMLSQMLPQKNYDTQYHMGDGQIVDAAIHLSGGIVPVDSKFPLESFRQLTDLEGDERKKSRREFVRACKKHIDSLADKYIRPKENVFNFAMMYVPAENVYYELIIRDEEDDSISDYALQRRVVPVSPNSFYAYLNVIVLGLRGMQIGERAEKIMGTLIQFEDDVADIQKELNTLGKHVQNASKKFTTTSNKLSFFGEKLANVSETELPARADLEALPPPK